MSRKLTVFIALLLVSVLVFACGKPAETPAPAPAPQPEEEATPAETAPAEEAPQVEGVTGKIVVVGSTSVSRRSKN